MLCTPSVCIAQAPLTLYLNENVAKCLVTSIAKAEKILLMMRSFLRAAQERPAFFSAKNVEKPRKRAQCAIF
jgi:hypothetical protein